jgi:hypothetical protein
MFSYAVWIEKDRLDAGAYAWSFHNYYHRTGAGDLQGRLIEAWNYLMPRQTSTDHFWIDSDGLTSHPINNIASESCASLVSMDVDHEMHTGHPATIQEDDEAATSNLGAVTGCGESSAGNVESELSGSFPGAAKETAENGGVFHQS